MYNIWSFFGRYDELSRDGVELNDSQARTAGKSIDIYNDAQYS